MWKKKCLRNVLLGGRAGMRAATVLPFARFLERAVRTDTCASVLVSIWSTWAEKCHKQGKSHKPSRLWTGPLPRITTKWRVTNGKLGIPASICKKSLWSGSYLSEREFTAEQGHSGNVQKKALSTSGKERPIIWKWFLYKEMEPESRGYCNTGSQGISVSRKQLMMAVKGKCSLSLRMWFYILVHCGLCLHLNVEWNTEPVDLA